MPEAATTPSYWGCVFSQPILRWVTNTLQPTKAQYYGGASSGRNAAVIATVTGTSNTLIGKGGYIASISGVGNQATFLPDVGFDPRVFVTLEGGATGYAYNAGSYIVSKSACLDLLLYVQLH